MTCKEFDGHHLLALEAGIKHAAQRGDIDRWIDLRVARGDDAMSIAADIAAQEG